MRVGDGYRQLDRSDIIRESDEWYDSHGKWHPITCSDLVGKEYWTYRGQCIRRKVEEQTMSGKWRDLLWGEVIKAGDQYLNRNEWKEVTGYGVPLSELHKPHRRWESFTNVSSTEHTKDSNPKDAVGVTKPPIHNVPRSVLSEVGMALAEGEWKYGGYNWRAVGVRASVYLDALDRHMTAWWEGEDADPDSGLSHITKAISALMVLRDGMIQENWVDDRPPRSKMDRKELANQYKSMLERLKSLQPDPVPGYTQKGVEYGQK